MRQLTIAVDVDEVVANLLTEWIGRYNTDYGDSVTLDQITEWDMTKVVKPECGSRIYDYLRHADLYQYVRPYDGAFEAVQALRLAGHRVVFVTSCVRGSFDQKAEWLVRNGFLPDRHSLRDFYPAADKSLIRADVLIDDNLDNVEKYPGLALLVTRPHNAALATTRDRISHLGEALAAIYASMGVLPAIYASMGAHPEAEMAVTDGESGAGRSVPPYSRDPDVFHRAFVALGGQTAVPQTEQEPSREELLRIGGHKDDKGKAQIGLIPPGPLMELAKLYTVGAKKYRSHQWRKGMKWSRVFDAMQRHAWAFWNGEDTDPEHGLSHMTSVAWCAFALLEYANTRPDLDDRFSTVGDV